MDPKKALPPSTWPSAPSRMSYSALTEIEACPHRWALSSASYPDVWDQRGYPRKPNMGALKGIAAHRALRLILTSLVQAGCASTKAPEAIQVMRKLGGFSLVVRRMVDEAILKEERNPRAKAFLEAVRCRIDPIVATVREEVQAILSIQELAAAMPVASGSARLSARKPLTQGSFPELELSDADFGWTGIVDLLNITTAGIEIIDFKTGEYDKSHESQVKLYSLLWARDTVLNPAGKLAGRAPMSGEIA